MGNSTRCPKCNRFGDEKLDGLCRACDNDMFKDKVFKLTQGSQRILNSILLEFKANALEAVKREDRSRFLNMIKRRFPIKRSRHIVSDSSKFETYAYSFVSESDKIKFEKGVCDIEH